MTDSQPNVEDSILLSNSAATIILVLLILNGLLGIFLGYRLKARHPKNARRERYHLRGILVVIVASIALLLLRTGLVSGLPALVSVSFFVLLGEYFFAAREKRRLIREGLYDPGETERRERQERERIKAKGKRRYVLETALFYGIFGFGVCAVLYISDPELLPIYAWVVGGLFAAICGAAAALEKWKRWGY